MSTATSPERVSRLRAMPSSVSLRAFAFAMVAPDAAWSCERLQPALVLVHLGELAVASVALDELPLARDRLRACVGVLAGPRVALLALAEVGAVVAAEDLEPSTAYLPDALDHSVEERPIVRGNDEVPGALAERLLKPLDRIDVEVVGGLVEQQQVDLRDEQPRQRGACLLTTRQLAWRTRPLGLGETQAGQRGVHAQVQRVAVAHLELVAQVLVLGSLDAGSAGRLQLGQAPLHRFQRVRTGADHVT